MLWLEPVRLRRGVPACEVRSTVRDGWRETIAGWLALPPHPSILAPVDRDGERLWVRYAELRSPPSREGAARIASWLLSLCDVYRHVDRARAIARLARPALAVDGAYGLRVGFLPADRADTDGLDLDAPLAGNTIPFVIGSIAEATWDEIDPRLQVVVDRACGRQPGKRPADVAVLEALLHNTSMLRGRPRNEREHAAWLDYDRGVGFTKLGDADSAVKSYRAALAHDPDFARCAPERDRDSIPAVA